jgi:hypothetical protein
MIYIIILSILLAILLATFLPDIPPEVLCGTYKPEVDKPIVEVECINEKTKT